ncbi:hypothetical protein [Roseinatronobacter alkalisoli]|uniref:Uncharacterized protein n=1 Tax=Roseinatronobacter alkalisoli TaxID=3028235 RepID=A0ABT5T3J9_9RHOB|nr:hypothetical protein [Roseinatronobacter sp. HJB301]MDD7969698.1 hypothetical protein [Roseinatronobacter sp. HJB301]
MIPEHDPKGLIRESYRIDGISMDECRSILIDWALSLPSGQDHMQAVQAMLDQYGPLAPDHPMTGLLREGMTPRAPRPRRGRSR